MTTPEEFAEAGLYDAETDATTGRLELLQWLDELGFSVSEMQVAHKADALGAMPGDRRLLPGPRMDRAGAAALAGLDLETFDAHTTAFGIRPIQTDHVGNPTFTEAEVDAIVLAREIGLIFSPDEALGFARVIGSSLGRITEAAVSLFLINVESPHLQAGESEYELARKVHDAVGLVDGLTNLLDPIMRRHMTQAIERGRQTMIGPHERLRYRYTVGFIDLVGFTSISGDMSAPELAGFIRDFEGRAHDTVTRFNARVVKLIGDEVMFVATDPADACRAGQALMDGFGSGPEPVLPRGGLAYGDVLLRGGDYYGPVVNLASRLVDEAVPAEILVTEELAVAAPSCDFEPAGRRMVKGFPDPVRVRSITQG